MKIQKNHNKYKKSGILGNYLVKKYLKEGYILLEPLDQKILKLKTKIFLYKLIFLANCLQNFLKR